MENTTPDIYEETKPLEAIESLCESHPDHSEFIRKTYPEILESVSSDATIRTYLTILISREVKALIMMKELSRDTPA